jgi:hypothetical protein
MVVGDQAADRGIELAGVPEPPVVPDGRTHGEQSLRDLGRLGISDLRRVALGANPGCSGDTGPEVARESSPIGRMRSISVARRPATHADGPKSREHALPLAVLTCFTSWYRDFAFA